MPRRLVTLDEAAARLRAIALGVRLYGAPDPTLLAERIEAICDEMVPDGDAQPKTRTGRRKASGCHECAWGKVLGCWRCGSR